MQLLFYIIAQILNLTACAKDKASAQFDKGRMRIAMRAQQKIVPPRLITHNYINTLICVNGDTFMKQTGQRTEISDRLMDDDER